MLHHRPHREEGHMITRGPERRSGVERRTVDLVPAVVGEGERRSVRGSVERAPNPITVRIKSGTRIPYEVTVVKGDDALQLSCTCGEDSPIWCSHIYAVICGDRVALASPNEVGNLVAAGERIEERIDVVAALTARRDSIQNQPGRRAEAEAMEVAIAKRLDDKLEG